MLCYICRRFVAVLFLVISMMLPVTIVYSISNPSVFEFTQPDNTHNDSCLIAGTSLELKKTVSYDGSFFEDGTGREVVDVMAVQVTNSSDKMIFHAWFNIELNAVVYSFEATYIPPCATVLIPEKNAKKFAQGEVTESDGWEIKRRYDLYDNDIIINVQDDTSVRIENQSVQEKSNLKLFYKTYLPMERILIGGMSHCVSVDTILPLENIAVYLPNFYKDYSRLIYVQ